MKLELVVTLNMWLDEAGRRQFGVTYQDGFMYQPGTFNMVESQETAIQQVKETIDGIIWRHGQYPG